MSKNYLKNIEFEKVHSTADLIAYQDNQVVSRTLVQNKSVSITLFSFDKNEEISSHASTGDAFVQVLEGTGEVTIGENKYILGKDQSIVMPAGIPHAVFGKERFKMMLVVVFPQQ